MSDVLAALERLYLETAEYISINHLGPVHHNAAMQMARDALIAAGSTATPSNVGHDGPPRSEPVTPKAQHPSGDVERVVRAAQRLLDIGVHIATEHLPAEDDKTFAHHGLDFNAALDETGAALAALRGAPAASGEGK